MIKQNQRILNTFNLFSDAALTFLAYFAALAVRFEFLKGFRSVNLQSKQYLLLIAAYCIAEVIVFYLMRVYIPQRYSRVTGEIMAILMSSAICLLILVAVLYVMRLVDVSRILIVLFYVINCVLVISKHLAVRWTMSYIRRMGFNLKHVILAGGGSQAYQYIENIRSNSQMGICIDGYVGEQAENEMGKWLGDFSQVRQVLKEHSDADELIIALTANQEGWLPDVIDAANRVGIRTKMIPSFGEFLPANPSIDVIGTTKLINLNASPLDNVLNALLKRLADVILSALGLVILSPVMLAVAVGVKMSSPGPVFFVQERVGRNKKNFRMLKFRSMRVNDSQNKGWSTDTDPRKTVFGSFIRKTSLDELPQLFNVLAGQMSLVGPRPEVPYHVEHFQEEIPQYMVRQQVRPGMTGWAQVNGYRGDTDIGKRIELDLWYIQNWCVRLDAEILWKTLNGGFVNTEMLTSGRGMKEE